MMKGIILCLLIILAACSEEQKKLSDIKPNVTVLDTTELDCNKNVDTTFALGRLKSLFRNGEMRVAVSFRNVDTVLPYSFNCETPNGLIPRLFDYDDTTVCLIRGYGQHFRELDILKFKKQSLQIKNFENFIALDLQNALVICRGEDNRNQIVFDYFNTDVIKTVPIPDYYIDKEVLKGIIKGHVLMMKFVGTNKTVVLKIPPVMGKL